MIKSSAHTQKLLVLLLAAGTLVFGCNMVDTGKVPAASVYGSTVPAHYNLTAANNLVITKVDLNQQGIVLWASLDELSMPNTWAKVTNSGSSYFLHNKTVTPGGADAALFVFGGSSYYAKYIQIGTGTDAQIFEATASGTSVVYTSASDSTFKLPDSAATAAHLKWYAAQMAAGNYQILSDATGTVMDGVDFTKTSTGAEAVAGATKNNRWLKSVTTATWKTERDKATKFLRGRIVSGAKSTDLTKKSGIWLWGTASTGVADTWTFDTYFPFVMKAYDADTTDTGTTSTGTGGSTTGGTDTTTGASE